MLDLRMRSYLDIPGDIHIKQLVPLIKAIRFRQDLVRVQQQMTDAGKYEVSWDAK
jgi:hypothetical protein